MEGNGEKKNTYYCEGGKNIQVWEEEAGLLSLNRHVWGVWEGEWVLLHTTDGEEVVESGIPPIAQQ